MVLYLKFLNEVDQYIVLPYKKLSWSSIGKLNMLTHLNIGNLFGCHLKKYNIMFLIQKTWYGEKYHHRSLVVTCKVVGWYWNVARSNPTAFNYEFQNINERLF